MDQPGDERVRDEPPDRAASQARARASRPGRAQPAGRALSEATSGLPSTSSGAATSIRISCCVMWAEKSTLPQGCSGETSATTSASQPAAKHAGLPRADAAPAPGGPPEPAHAARVEPAPRATGGSGARLQPPGPPELVPVAAGRPRAAVVRAHAEPWRPRQREGDRQRGAGAADRMRIRVIRQSCLTAGTGRAQTAIHWAMIERTRTAARSAAQHRQESRTRPARAPRRRRSDGRSADRLASAPGEPAPAAATSRQTAADQVRRQRVRSPRQAQQPARSRPATAKPQATGPARHAGPRAARFARRLGTRWCSPTRTRHRRILRQFTAGPRRPVDHRVQRHPDAGHPVPVDRRQRDVERACFSSSAVRAIDPDRSDADSRAAATR